ncbi:MAG: SCO family protein, partial [Pseudomonadota bacterium]
LDLVDQHGTAVTEHSFAGQHMLIYFGYTYCPDVCPTTLSTMIQALDLLPAKQAEQVVPIFITIDPERDTVEQMALYAPLFHPRLVALTGTREATDSAAKAYRVLHKKAGGGDDYLVDHSSFVFLMGPDGAYVDHFHGSVSPKRIAEGMAEALASG